MIINEDRIASIIRNSINTFMLRESLNEHVDMGFFKGLSYIDDGSIRSIIQQMIPLNNRMGKAEYKPIRQLVLYFDPENGITRHGSANDKMIANYIMGTGSFMGNANQFPIADDYAKLKKEDAELKKCIYGTTRAETRKGVVNTHLQGAELIRQVGWHIQTILETVQMMMLKIDKSNVTNYFSDMQGMKGAENGKIKGLIAILFDANENLNKIKDIMDKLEVLAKRGKDPLSYNVNGRRY